MIFFTQRHDLLRWWHKGTERLKTRAFHLCAFVPLCETMKKLITGAEIRCVLGLRKKTVQ
jgi:hypothetical protein